MNTMAKLLQEVVHILFCLCVCFVIQIICVQAEKKHHCVVMNCDGLYRVVQLDGPAQWPVLQKGDAPLAWGWFDSAVCASTG